MMARFLLLAAAIFCSGIGIADSAPAEDRLRETYFAPIMGCGLWRMRMEDGAIREFEAEIKPNKLRSVDGWRAVVDGKRVIVTSGPRVRPERIYEFESGTLRRYRSAGVTVCPDYREPVVYVGERICPLWPDLSELTPEKRHIQGTWEKDSRRLKLWFDSPNQAGGFLSLVFLVGAVLALFVPRLWICGAGCVLSLATVVPIIHTDSRGTIVATGFTFVMLVVCALWRRKRLTWRTLTVGVLLLALVLGGVLASMRLLSNRASGSRAQSNEIRLQVWKAAPQMMCDAPWGWGPALRGAGNAYSSWYVPLKSRYRQYSLINDHLTILVSWGWLGGGVYLMLWFGGLWLLWAFAFRGGFPLPAAWWTGLGICSFFNVVLLVPLLHWLPLAPLILLAFDRRWMRGWLPLHALAVGAFGAVAVLGALAWLGTAGGGGRLALHRDGKTVAVNGAKPQVCIVDDRETIGASKTIHELRHFYSVIPQGAPVAYATDLQEALSHDGYRRLVVVGKRCAELLERFAAGSEGRRLPAEVVFLSPPFPPSELPEALYRKARVTVVIGEFYARYYPELARPQPGVRVVKGAEMYIPGWMVYCLSDVDS